MITTLYANYGVLAHERQTVYTTGAPHAQAISSEEITVDIPDEVKPCLNECGSIVVTIGGMRYMLSELLIPSKYEAPALIWYDGHNWHRLPLLIIPACKQAKR